MSANDKFIEYLKSKNENNSNDSVKCLETFVNNNKPTNFEQQILIKTARNSQELTKEYDYHYERTIEEELLNRKSKDFLPYNFLETLYICFTYFRRNDLKIELIELYQIVLKTTPELLNTELLESYKYYYYIYSFVKSGDKGILKETSYCLITDENLVEGIKNPLHETTFKYKITKVTFADAVFKILEANKDKFKKDNKRYLVYYERCLDAIEDVLSDDTLNGYALYYSIKANIQLLGLKLGMEHSAKIEEIRENIETALKKEKSSNTGLRKKTQYLSQLSDLNLYEANKKIEASESKVKEIEANSIRKFSAFSAFVTFAVGLISKFINSEHAPFHETVGYFLVLISISTAIFSFFDLLILGPLSANESEKHHKKDLKHIEVAKFIIKLFIELIIILATFIMGLQIGRN